MTAWYSRHDSDILLCTQTSRAQVGLHRKQFSSLCTAHFASVLRRFPVLQILKNDDDGYPLVDGNGSTLVPIPREGPLDEDEASSLTAWAQGYREVRKNLFDSVTGRGYIRTPFRDNARDHSTERATGAELRKRTRCYRCRQVGHMARVCQKPAPKDTPNLQPRISF